MSRISGTASLRAIARDCSRILLGLVVASLLAMLAATPASARIYGLEISEYQHDFGVSNARAEATLEIEDKAAEADVVQGLERRLGNRYAGLWFDNETGEFVVPMLPGAERWPVSQEFADAGIPGEFRTAPARSSMQELLAAHERIDEALLALIEGGEVSTWVDPRTNAVVVEEAPGADTAVSARIQGAAQGVALERRPSQGELGEQTMGCDIEYHACPHPLRGGVQLISHSGGWTSNPCTAGFKAIGKELSHRFILTAGHCVEGTQTWFAENPAKAYAEEEIGPTAAWSYPEHDWAAINATKRAWDDESWPSQIAEWEIDNQHPISSESASYLGEYVCHTGVRTNTHCAYVTELDHTARVEEEGQEAKLVKHETMFGPVCVFYQDSGGPAFIGNTALGIMSLATLNASESESEQWAHHCEVSGEYIEITEIAEALQVTVATREAAIPAAKTEGADNIQAESHRATLHGEVRANGSNAYYLFQYGTSTSYGSSTGPLGTASGWEFTPVSGTIEGLKGNTTYHYRVAANNEKGDGFGEDQTFTTPDWHPTVTVEAPSSISSEGATLKGTVNPQGYATTYHFEYGLTTSYGTSVPIPDASVGSGASAVAVSQAVTGLRGERTYHYRIVASNAEGTSTSGDQSFTTKARPAVYNSTIGAPGWGGGKFEEPSGMARDSAGNLWVADTRNDRVEEFNAKGEFVREFGSYGTTPGHLNEPRDVAIDPSGNVWVTDAANARIQEFSSQGFYIRQWGPENQSYALTKPYGIETTGTAAEAFLWVTDPGGDRIVEFKATSQKIEQVQTWTGGGVPGNLAGITRDAEGNLWTVDPIANRVYKLSPGGTFSSAFGTAGAGAGQLAEPYGIAVRPSGNLMIAERGNSRVQLFTPGGEYLGGFGTKGTAGNQLSEPRDVLAGAGGTIYVSDTANNRVKNWGIPWEPEATTGSASAIGASEATLGGTVNPSCIATSYYFEYGTTTAYGSSSASQSAGSGCEPVAASKTITGLRPETVYHYRLRATSVEGTATGEDRTVTIGARPASYLSSFGSYGTGNGQFFVPMGIARDAEGNIWVADRENDRVQEFSAKGEYLSQFGSPGAGQGQLSDPRGVAINSQGNLWIADAGNGRIEEFTPQGQYVREAGGLEGGVDHLTAPYGLLSTESEGAHYLWATDGAADRVVEFKETTQGVTFVKEATLEEPPLNSYFTGIAQDAQGTIWIADSSANKIDELSPSSKTIVPVFGSYGTTAGKLFEPRGIAFRPSGALMVVEKGNNRVQLFSPSGAYLGGFGSAGSGEGQMSKPEGVLAGPGGTIYVTDAGNDRVQRWGIPSAPEATTGSASAIGASEATLGGTVNPAGAATSFYFEYGTTTSYGSSSASESAGSGYEPVAVSKQVTGLSAETTYHYRVVATSVEGTAYGEDKTFKTVAVTPTYQSAFGTSGSGNGQLKYPADTALDASGNVWVVDRGNNRIEKFNSKGEYVSQFGSEGTGDGQFKSPAGIAIDSSGNIWVADRLNYRVQKFNSAGTFLLKFGSRGSGNGQFSIEGPKSLAFDASGNAWVSDYSGRIQKFSASGEFLKAVGTKGTGDGQFGQSSAIDIAAGKIWVGDWENSRVQVFNEAGEFLFKFGTKGTGNGQFVHADALDVDSKGNVFVGDEGNDRVEQFNSAGEYVTKFGSFGSGEGQFNLTWPTGLTTDENGNIWIADTSNNRVQKWTYLP
jgi:sugar lactone lactonase YvrE